MIWIIVGIVVILILFVIGTYNSLISLRNKKDDQWSQIEVQLKRRADLIPNLVETVKGYAKHENNTLKEVIEARNTYVAASTPEEEMKASGEVTKALNKLFALSESYPDLKANENFKELQKAIVDVEEHLQASRRCYNANVSIYNQLIVSFPINLVAKNKKMTKNDFFEIEESKKENVKIEL